MLEKLLDYERELFLCLNNAHSPFGNQLMWLYSGHVAWIPVVATFLFVLFYSNRTRWKETILVLAAIVLVITICDQFSSGLCKDLFRRFRPTHHPDFMNDVITVFGYRGGRYGFISSHAANGFGFATLTSLIFRKKAYTIAIYLWATVFAYSRIYLGVHFITDIIPGICAGLFFGWVVFRLFAFTHKKVMGRNDSTIHGSLYPNNGITLILTMLSATFILMIISGILYACDWIPALTFK